MSNLQVSHVLVVAAMPEEIQGLFEAQGFDVLYTGLGKVNASYLLTKALTERRLQGKAPALVINFGTAGSSRFNTHEIVEITRFVQRDMDVSPLGFAVGETPFDKLKSEVACERRFPLFPEGTCGTGDSFEIGTPRVRCDVVDMEAFALAKICALEQIEFSCIKYISDGADHNAHNDWAANLPKAAARFIEIYERLLKSDL